MSLRWEEHSNADGVSWWGYTGGLRVSFVLQPAIDNPDRKWMWTFELTGGKWLGTTEGHCKDASSAKRQAERAFARWLEKAGLRSSVA